MFQFLFLWDCMEFFGTSIFTFGNLFGLLVILIVAWIFCTIGWILYQAFPVMNPPVYFHFLLLFIGFHLKLIPFYMLANLGESNRFYRMLHSLMSVLTFRAFMTTLGLNVEECRLHILARKFTALV